MKRILTLVLVLFFSEDSIVGQTTCEKVDLKLSYPKNPTAKVWKINNAVIGYVSEMTIDVDGSPRAYHPQNIGLDNLSSAGGVGNLSTSVIVFEGNKPYIQKSSDPFPGYYLSQTSLVDATKKATDYRRYVNSEEIPYIAIPPNLIAKGVKKGDLAYVFNQKTNKGSFAIVADTGNNKHIGEGSVKLSENLGIKLIYKKNLKQIIASDSDKGIVYLIFPNSGNNKPLTLAEIEAKSQQFDKAEIKKMIACL